FHIDGRMMREGDRFALPQLADTLEALAPDWRRYYDDVLVAAMLDQFGPARGGLLTREDFDAYEVVFREPLEVRYHHSRVLTPPPPAAGGPMIAMMLELLHHRHLAEHEPGGVDHTRRLACAMAVADESRREGAEALSEPRFSHWHDRFDALLHAEHLPKARTPGGPGSTTHISVIDHTGTSAAVTFSYGEGNAHVIGDTGIVMNNLMGEEDLFPDGFDAAPRGRRLPTMMSPTLLLDDEGGVTALGTGGANRIRTAIVQVITRLHDHGEAPEVAVASPRLHFEAGVLNVETFEHADGGDALTALGADKLVRFPERNMFFGGVHIARRDPDGALSGGGDPRRGGVLRIV
ncbi:MAG: gamma-glutamyltransferase, partial [Myxococcales bacterium]|nr:gamma-glutamyltransferase [Myxococcales bacterium]